MPHSMLLPSPVALELHMLCDFSFWYRCFPSPTCCLLHLASATVACVFCRIRLWNVAVAGVWFDLWSRERSWSSLVLIYFLSFFLSFVHSGLVCLCLISVGSADDCALYLGKSEASSSHCCSGRVSSVVYGSQVAMRAPVIMHNQKLHILHQGPEILSEVLLSTCPRSIRTPLLSELK